MKPEIKSFLSFCYMTALTLAGFAIVIAAVKVLEFLVMLI